MSVRPCFRVRCDFCDASGPVRGGERDAVEAAADCPKAIRRIYRSVYGDEVWACAKCLASDAEAKAYAETEGG